MKTLLLILQTVAGLSGVLAIMCIAAHCAYEMLAFAERRYDDIGRMDIWAWAGLLWAAIWIACEIGMIGL